MWCVFILCILISIYAYIPDILYWSCEIYPQLDWMKSFWEMCAYVSYHMQLMCMVEYFI